MSDDSAAQVRHSFCLDVEPWLTVQGLSGGPPHAVSFRDLLKDAHRISRIVLESPPGQAALLRVLAVMAYRVSGLDGPDDTDVWRGKRNAALVAGAFGADAVDAYFDRYADRFDLLGADRPWMQDPRLKAECKTQSGINKLVVYRPSGNNAAFLSPFHSENQGAVTAASAVEHLLVDQYYGPSGRCTSRTHGTKTAAGFTAIGPLRSRISYHAQGANLFETLIANLVCPARFAPVGASDRASADLADWEQPTLYNPLIPRPVPAGIVSYLAGNSGHALLVDGVVNEANGDLQITDGWYTWRYAAKSEVVALRDPYLAYKQDAKGQFTSRQARAGVDLWRDLPALLSPADDPHGYKQPVAIEELATLPEDVRRRLQIAAYGFVQHGYQPTNEEWQASLTPPVVIALRSMRATANGEVLPDNEDLNAKEWNDAINKWVGTAEAEAKLLRSRLTRALQAAYRLKPHGSERFAWANKVQATFWKEAYSAFAHAVETSASGQDFARTELEAPTVLRGHTLRLYDIATQPARDGRALAAVVRNRPLYLAGTRNPGVSTTPPIVTALPIFPVASRSSRPPWKA